MELDLDWINIYDNVLILHYEEKLENIINISDIWLAYESTTLLEAWASNKPTINIIPSSVSWRPDIYKGSCVINNYENLQLKINEYYSSNKINQFELKKEIRKKIIKNSITSIDGKNSYRTSKIIIKYLTNLNNKVNIRKSNKIIGKILKFSLNLINKLKFLRIFNKYVQLEKILNINKEINKIKLEYYKQMNNLNK